MLLASLLLVLAADDPGPDPGDHDSVVATIEVIGGRATLQVDSEETLLLRRSPPARVRQGFELEVGPGSEARVRLAGRSSLRIRGPAELRWPDPGEAGARGRVELERPGSVEWEVREGTRTLDLAGGWTLTSGPGASAIEACGGGAVRARCHGGGPLRVATRVKRPPGSWQAVVRPGRETRLDPPPPTSRSRGTRAGPGGPGAHGPWM